MEENACHHATANSSGYLEFFRTARDAVKRHALEREGDCHRKEVGQSLYSVADFVKKALIFNAG